jgi:hypothetical protein
MQAFRRREILPDDAPFFSEEALCWPTSRDDLKVKDLPFGGPLGLGYNERRQTARTLKNFIDQGSSKELLGLDPRRQYAIPSFHALYRVNRAGSVRWDLVVEVVQTMPATPKTFPMRGGTTMIISTHGTGGGGVQDEVFVRYVIPKPLDGGKGRLRLQRQQAYLDQLGIKPGGKAGELRVNFALVHGEA